MPDPRLVVISGPSCVGKSPLLRALRNFHPECMETTRDLVLYNSREPRPGETDGVDYHFRGRAEIEAMRDYDRYVVIEARNDLQAVDVEELQHQLEGGDVLYEGNPYVARVLLKSETLADIPRLSIFISPLSGEEIRLFKSAQSPLLAPTVTDIMRRKLLRRANRMYDALTEKQLEDVERRAKSAPSELKYAPHFDHVVPNHDGEDSENWEDFHFPIGDARRSMGAVAALLRAEPTPFAETWEARMFNPR